MASGLPHAEASSLQSALQLDPNQQNHPIQPPAQQPQASSQAPARKRKKNESGDDAAAHSEPRRLRRSHEACFRCRSKKIKCDSKHPRCTACATAGTPCKQEDRHRQTLTPRGHTERLEQQLAQCEVLLKRHVQGFDLNCLDDILVREGLDPNLPAPNFSADFQFNPPSRLPTSPGGSSAKPYPYPQQHLIPHGYPLPLYGPHGAPYHMTIPMQSPGPYNPPVHPAFQHPSPHYTPPQPFPPRAQDIKGQDPQANDMSNSQALAKTFGVSAAIVNDLKLTTSLADREDLGVGSSELTSGRDRNTFDMAEPSNPNEWISVPLRRSNISDLTLDQESGTRTAPSLAVWVPKDRNLVKHIVDVYFTRLNVHRPVLVRKDMEATLDAVYDGRPIEDDAGCICSLYLILALGTLSELNHRESKHESVSSVSPRSRSKALQHDWPAHDEFFQLAMTFKSDLRVTISSLQALILLHWYLYTERQGRTLWRLVGSLVRVAIELGLHHDPTAQGNTFTEEESRLRINLWAIVMVHDRGTSILLGRPLAIAPSDSNTPRPSNHLKEPDFKISEHFLLSSPLAEIQADIINSLYMPTRQSGDAIMRHATRIIKSMVVFRNQLPESYKLYFGGTEEWPLDKRLKLVQDITEDQGLTLLKLGIARILLLRVLFNSKDLSYHQRHKALLDAIVTSHNIIIVHNQLIRFPDIAFFVSPIPLHIAAMVILYGHMSHCDRLTREVAVEDVWLALDLLPRLRWRWERKDSNGGHPLIARLAEKVLGTNIFSAGPPSTPLLLSEPDWDDVSVLLSPSSSSALPPSQQSNGAVNLNYTGPGSPVYARSGPQTRGVTTVPTTDNKQQLVEVPTSVFYPFYPENHNTFPSGRFEGAPHVSANGAMNGDLSHILAPPSAQTDGTFASQTSHDTVMMSDRERTNGAMDMWMGLGNRGLQFPIQQT